MKIEHGVQHQRDADTGGERKDLDVGISSLDVMWSAARRRGRGEGERKDLGVGISVGMAPAYEILQLGSVFYSEGAGAFVSRQQSALYFDGWIACRETASVSTEVIWTGIRFVG